jgi:Tol biopolymer transport system component
VALVALAATAGAGIVWWLRPLAPTPRTTYLNLTLNPADELYDGAISVRLTAVGSRTALAWTPDGQAPVFGGRRNGQQQLYVRRLDSPSATPLRETDGAQAPAVSPDGQWVAFWADNAIWKKRLSGDEPRQRLVPVGQGFAPTALAWDDEGRLYYSLALSGSPIWMVSTDGVAVPVTAPGEGERIHLLPSPLPRQRGFSVHGTETPLLLG